METRQMYLTSGHPNRPGDKITIKGVVVHWTANESRGAEAIANRNYFNRAWKGTLDSPKESDGSNFRWASAHLNVDDTKLVECLPWKKGEAEMGYHVGGIYRPGICEKLGTDYPNDATIGLEICVNSDGNFAVAYANAIKVIAMMLKEHGLGINDLYRHYDITGKLCPGFHTQDAYAQKYLGTTASIAWADFKASVSKELTPPEPQYYKVYQQGALYNQYTTGEGAEANAKILFIFSGGKDATIYAANLDGTPLYTPAKHPSDFPQFQPKPAPPKEFYRLMYEGKQQGAYSVVANGELAAKDLYRKTKSPNIVLNNPDGTAYYTPFEHPEDFPDLIVDGLDADTQKAVFEYLKKKFQ
jgi:N-acetylmuramoyl-L-alanine amidase CwlA